MKIWTAISGYLGISDENVVDIVDRAPTLYRRYLVPKKRGGNREIYHPAKETKAVQAAAVYLLQREDLVLDCVKGYVRGIRSPLFNNALTHAGSLFLLKLDFTDFFPSIKPNDFRKVCADRLLLHEKRLEPDDLDFLCKLFFVFNRRLGWFLGIGAPSSPFISNCVMYNIDRDISAACAEMGCKYTRYADDLCISTDSKKRLLATEDKIKEVVTACPNPQLVFNNSKRMLASKWSRRRVTGLSITPLGEVKVPRDMKRYVRALVHQYKLKTISDKDKLSLAGYLAFLNDCEPAYFNNLALKYGADTIYRVLKKR
jgi:RNA-directed DNA polymerase